MKKPYIIAFSILLSSLYASAQAVGPNKVTSQQLSQVVLSNNYRVDELMLDLLAKKTNVKTGINNEALNADYINKPFVLGSIYYKDKKMSQEYYVRYNGLKDVIEISNNNESDIILKNTRISCTIKDSKYIYSKLTNGDRKNRGYLKLIYTGTNHTLYQREVVIYKEPRKTITTLTPNVRAKYIKFISFYKIDKGSKIAEKIPATKKSFISTFKKQYQKDIKAFIKAENIDLRKEEDIIKVYKYYETVSYI